MAEKIKHKKEREKIYMKKLLALTLVFVMLFTLVACGNNETPNDNAGETTEAPVNTDSNIIAPEAGEDTLPFLFWNIFKGLKEEAPLMGTEELAYSILNSEAGRVCIQMGMAMPVEPGFLQGFDNAEITGFKSGAVFAPGMMGAPFIGYVFELEEGADVKAFMKTLEDNSNLSWNVCTTADMKAVGAIDNTVFFIMCAKEVPAALSGEIVIIEPTIENAPKGEALWNEFKTAMGQGAAGAEDVSYRISMGAAFTYGDAVVALADAETLEGFSGSIFQPEDSYSFKAEGNDFVGYVFTLERGVDIASWLDYCTSMINDGTQFVAGAYDTTILVLINTDAE